MNSESDPIGESEPIWESEPIRSPCDSDGLDELCRLLREISVGQEEESWPGDQLRLCGQANVFRWFVPEDWGGYAWSPEDIVKGYLKLSAACLKTTFVITQRTAACRCIIASSNDVMKSLLLPDLASGQLFATVGISHLTTSRRHVAKPVLRAQSSDRGIVIDGFSPWVTGAASSNYLVLGAEYDDGRQILFAVSSDANGLTVETRHRLVALTGSDTGAVRFDGVELSTDCILAGPIENVISSAQGAATGGLQTSTLALGLAAAAIEFISSEGQRRNRLLQQSQKLEQQWESLKGDLLALARGQNLRTRDELRIDANSLVLRATQSALVAAKGAGYVIGHPVGRWCKEALFFLVWSCPQSVLDANLCELAGIQD